jgi:ABC-2 type transport system permease protein
MKWERVKAVVRKEFIQIRRDLRSLILALVIPAVMMILFGYAVTMDIKEFPVGVYDQDQTQKSAQFIKGFEKSGYFSIKDYSDNYSQLEKSIERGKIKIGLVIPKNFSKGITAGEEVKVQVILDGSDANTSTIGLGYLSGLVSSYSKDLWLEKIIIPNFLLPLDPQIRIWYNQDMKSQNFVIPGLIAVIMMIMGGLLTSLCIAREWERGTMEQLIATPIKPSELVGGKFIPYLIIGLFDVTMVVLLGVFVFGVPLRGDILFLAGSSMIFLLGATGIGMLISILVKSQLLANMLGILTTFLPSFLLSGFIFPIFNMPKPIQLLTYLVPARYFISILQGIFLKGSGIKVLWYDLLFLILFSFLVVGLAITRFRKKLG